jgi:hypothetical protein
MTDDKDSPSDSGSEPLEKGGFRLPPVKHRFKNGHPKLGGRKKGTKNYDTLYLEAAQEKVTVVKNGRRLKLRRVQVSVEKRIQKFTEGEDKAVAHYRDIEAKKAAMNDHQSVEPLDDFDIRSLDDLVRRIRETPEIPPEEH